MQLLLIALAQPGVHTLTPSPSSSFLLPGQVKSSLLQGVLPPCSLPSALQPGEEGAEECELGVQVPTFSAP